MTALILRIMKSGDASAVGKHRIDWPGREGPPDHEGQLRLTVMIEVGDLRRADLPFRRVGPKGVRSPYNGNGVTVQEDVFVDTIGI